MILSSYQHAGPPPEQEPQYYQWNDPTAAPAYWDRDAEPLRAAGGPTSDAERFLPWVCLAIALFAMAVFSVVREIQHSRELYRMSQEVTLAEAQRRQCLEALRMSEAREARLQAELQGRPLLAGHPQNTPANAGKSN